jgi:hypothetical protein
MEKDNKIIIILSIIIICILYRKKIIENMKVTSSSKGVLDLTSLDTRLKTIQNSVSNIFVNLKDLDGRLTKIENSQGTRISPGQLLNTQMIKNVIPLNEKGEKVYGPRQEWNDVGTIEYTPVSDTSNIYIFFSGQYSVGGFDGDSVHSEIKINDKDVIAKSFQRWDHNDSAGGGTRSGTLFPLAGYYENRNKENKKIAIRLYTKWLDDYIHIYLNTIIIQEYSRQKMMYSSV